MIFYKPEYIIKPYSTWYFEVFLDSDMQTLRLHNSARNTWALLWAQSMFWVMPDYSPILSTYCGIGFQLMMIPLPGSNNKVVEGCFKLAEWVSDSLKTLSWSFEAGPPGSADSPK